MNKSQTSRDRRRDLLDTGRRLFAQRPYDQLSMDDLAAEAGVAKGLLYYYFDGKRGFYLAVVEDAAQAVRAAAAGSAGDTPMQRLRSTIDAYLRYAAESPEAWRAFTAGGIGFDPEVRAIHDRERGALRDLILAAVSPAPEAPPRLRNAVEGWLSFVEGSTLDWLDRGGLDAGEVADLLVAALDGAVAAAGGRLPG